MNFRECLLSEVDTLAPDAHIGLLLSGGMDSASILFALHERRRNVTAYSFTLETRLSKDFQYARALATHFNFPFVPIYLPSDTVTLERDCILLASKYRCKRKTQFECVWPFLYAYPLIAEPIISFGIGAEGLFCSTKHAVIGYRQRPDDFRRAFFSDHEAGQRQQHAILSAEYAKTVFAPFFSPRLFDCFIGTTWEECNHPHIKQPEIDAFPELFGSIKTLRQNLQKGDSGIAHHFEQLLHSSLNRRQTKSMVAFYNDLVKEYGN